MRFRGSLQDIRLFVAAYEAGSFTAASEREHTTQSGVSHHIRQLENRLEVKLFVRDKAGVTATPAADMLYQRCVEALRSLDDAVNGISSYTRGRQGRFTVGMLPAYTRRLAAPALLRFAQFHPNVRVRLVESQGSLAKMVQSEEIDFAISSATSGQPGIKERLLLVTPECLISRADTSEREPVVRPLPSGSIKLGLPTLQGDRRAAILSCLQAHGVQVESEFEIRSSFAGLDLVSQSHWRMVAPCLCLNPSADEHGFEVSPLRNPDVNFPVVAIENAASALAPEAEEFIEVFAQVAREAHESWMGRFQEAGLL